MRALWLIPDNYSFLLDELGHVAACVPHLSVLSQAVPCKIPDARVFTIPADVSSPKRVFIRISHLLRSGIKGSLPRQQEDWRKLRRLARHNEVIADLVRQEKIDVIHSHFAVPEGTAGWQAACGRPVVLTLRGVDILTLPESGYGFMLDPFYVRNLKRAVQKVAIVTVASRQTYDAALRIGTPEHKLRLIPNGVDLERFRPQPEAGLELRDRMKIGQRRLILAAGNLVPGKGFDRLIDAFASVKFRHPDAVLLIAGDGAERAFLEAQIADKKLEQAVMMPGKLSRDDMPVAMSAATLFVHPSLSEGFGNVILEAMACQCPVVATHTGAAADLIEDGVNGRIVPVNDVPALAGAIQDMLSSDQLRRQCANKALAQVQQSYSLQARAKAFVDIYKHVLGR